MDARPAPRLLMRMALGIHESLSSGNKRLDLSLPEHHWNSLCRIVRRLQLAQLRGWKVATDQSQFDFESKIGTLIRYLEAQAARSVAHRPSEMRTRPQEIASDLQALYDEFSIVQIDRRKHQLSVETGNICLEGIDLGRFSIVLDWARLGEPSSYRVVALDPNPAGSDTYTTHPHVRDESLCEGDGHLPIHRALRQGRLFDFFVLVRQILETYNSSSAYIRLSGWNRTNCRDCGALLDEDDVRTCERCGTNICCDCGSNCESCGNTHCSNCSSYCNGCNQPYCGACLNACIDCESNCCQDCLTEGRCECCHQQLTENESDENPIPANPTEPKELPNPALQSTRLD